MSQELNNLLADELNEAHYMFDNIIAEMKENGIEYDYDEVIRDKENSYIISYNSINKLNGILDQYNFIRSENEDFLNNEKKLIMKYISLYIASIVMIRVFCKTLSADKLNEIWYTMIDIVLGSASIAMASKARSNYRCDRNEKRDLYNSIYSLKESYNANYDLAANNINHIFYLCRKIVREIRDIKVLNKIKNL